MTSSLSNVGSTSVLEDQPSIQVILDKLLQEAGDLPSNVRPEQIAWIERQRKVLEREEEELMSSAVKAAEIYRSIDQLIENFQEAARKNAENLKMKEVRRAKESLERSEFTRQFGHRMKQLYLPPASFSSSSGESLSAKTADARDLRIEHAQTIWKDSIERVIPDQKMTCSQKINELYQELKKAPEKHDRLGIEKVISRELIQQQIIEAQEKIKKKCPELRE